MTDAEVEEMRTQIAKELETDPLDGGITVPDGGDGVTRYPQDAGGGIVTPEDMPDYEEPEEDKPSEGDK
jgi:hypothetical protein